MKLPLRPLSLLFFVLLSALVAFQVTIVANAIKQEENIFNTQVILDAKVTKDDVFQLYYLPAGASDFTDENSVIVGVVGSTESQLIVFDLPADSISGLRLDLGQEISQEEIMLNSLTMTRGKATAVVKQSELLEHFTANNFVTVKPASNGLKLQETNGVYDPFLVLKEKSTFLTGSSSPVNFDLSFYSFIVFVVLLIGSFNVAHRIKVGGISFLYLVLAAATYFTLLFALSALNLNFKSKSEEVTVALKVKVEVNDVLQLFYTTPESPGFTEEQSITKSIRAKDGFQTIKFSIPASAVKQLRFDISSYQSVAPVYLNKFVINYNGRSAPLKISDLGVNEYVTAMEEGGALVLKPQVVEGVSDPFIITSDLSGIFEDLRASNIKIPANELLAMLISLVLLIYLYQRAPFNDVTKERALPLAVSASFIFLLITPFLKTAFFQDDDYNAEAENRKLTDEPTFSKDNMQAYPSEFAAYYNDNFGFRHDLIELGRQIRMGIFRESHFPDKVAVGENGWLFISGEYENVTEDFAHRNLYDSLQLENMKHVISNKRGFCEASGAKFYKAVYPNAQSVYPEYLPYQIRMQRVNPVSRVDQVNQYLAQQKIDFKVIKVVDELISAKQSTPLYFKHDTHWNAYGAFVAYQKLFSVISKDFPALKPAAINDFAISWRPELGGDLLHMLGVQNIAEYYEDKPYFIPHKQVSILESTGPYPNSVVTENPNDSTGLVAVIFHDSYTTALKQFISPHFKKVIYYWGDFNYHVIENEKPDVVIEGNVERYFH